MQEILSILPHYSQILLRVFNVCNHVSTGYKQGVLTAALPRDGDGWSKSVTAPSRRCQRLNKLRARGGS